MFVNMNIDNKNKHYLFHQLNINMYFLCKYHFQYIDHSID